MENCRYSYAEDLTQTVKCWEVPLGPRRRRLVLYCEPDRSVHNSSQQQHVPEVPDVWSAWGLAQMQSYSAIQNLTSENINLKRNQPVPTDKVVKYSVYDVCLLSAFSVKSYDIHRIDHLRALPFRAVRNSKSDRLTAQP